MAQTPKPIERSALLVIDVQDSFKASGGAARGSRRTWTASSSPTAPPACR